MLLLDAASVPTDRSAVCSCANVMVACSASSHLPPLVMSAEPPLAAPPAAAVATAGSPQKTAMRPEHELLVTCRRG